MASYRQSFQDLTDRKKKVTKKKKRKKRSLNPFSPIAEIIGKIYESRKKLDGQYDRWNIPKKKKKKRKYSWE